MNGVQQLVAIAVVSIALTSILNDLFKYLTKKSIAKLIKKGSESDTSISEYLAEHGDPHDV